MDNIILSIVAALGALYVALWYLSTILEDCNDKDTECDNKDTDGNDCSDGPFKMKPKK